MKKIFKALVVFIGLLVTVLFMADNIEEWAYKKFGKAKVRNYMKQFEPYIVLSDDDEEVEASEETVEGDESSEIDER